MKNPHMSMRAMSPPQRVPGPDKRVWECGYCHQRGKFDELRAKACTYVYPPCKTCGQTPECARDCGAVLKALANPNVKVIR